MSVLNSARCTGTRGREHVNWAGSLGKVEEAELGVQLAIRVGAVVSIEL
jgi:hypothetical protein